MQKRLYPKITGFPFHLTILHTQDRRSNTSQTDRGPKLQPTDLPDARPALRAVLRAVLSYLELSYLRNAIDSFAYVICHCFL